MQIIYMDGQCIKNYHLKYVENSDKGCILEVHVEYP